MIHDKLGDRMKRYENVPQNKLMRRTPVIIRLDGKAFHSFTKGLRKPWDAIFHAAMEETMLYLCKNIQNCVFGLTQSDEISLLLLDNATLTTDAWFDNEVMKLCSVSASMATMVFNKTFQRLVEEEIWEWNHSIVPQSVELQQEVEKYHQTLRKKVQQGAMFDSRCFNVPFEETTNYYYWRMKDAERNSINSCGQYYFSHKELEGKNTSQVKEMLLEKGIHWETISNAQKYGVTCYKTVDGWYIDHNFPLLKDKDRVFLDSLVGCG